MAFKVNFDPTIGFLVSNMSYMPSFRYFGGLIWPYFELSKKKKIKIKKITTCRPATAGKNCEISFAAK